MPTTAIVASQILDSGLTGRELIQAADQAAAQAIIGVDPSQYGLLSANNTWTGFNTFQDDLIASYISASSIYTTGSINISEDLEVQGGLIANGAEFSGEVEFTNLITGVGGELQGDLTMSQTADMIVTGGGGYKLYNIGTEGDADTEYLETLADFALGTATPEFRLQSASTGVGVVRGFSIAVGTTSMFTFDSSLVNISHRTLRPNPSNFRDLGTSSYRWANVYSVDGDFSGTVTTDTINSTTGISLEISGSSKFNVANNGITYAYQSIQPGSTPAATTLGANPRRWGNVYSVDGSFSGNLITEAGGSQRVYNLGTEGDTDTAYFDISYDSVNNVTLSTNATGSGVAGKMYLRTGTSLALNLTLSAIYIYRNFLPSSNGSWVCGGSSLRWSNVYSVDGDFSGTVTSDTIDNTWYLSGGANMFLTNVNGIQAYQQIIPNSDGSQTVGLKTRRFGGIHGVDGSYSGNLNVEVGGTQRIYGLGTEGDTDTEYLETSLVGGSFEIETKATGSGAARTLNLRAGTFRFYAGGSLALASSVGYTLDSYYNIVPKNPTRYLGTTALRWANVASVDGDFSGDITIGGHIEKTLTLFTKINGSIITGHTNFNFQIYRDIIPATTGSVLNGAGSRRWANTYSVDGSFSGNLNVESGGSQRLYYLGTEGDTDTEFLEMSWDASGGTPRGIIAVSSTGSGVSRELILAGNSFRIRGAGGVGDRFYVDSNSILFQIDGKVSNGVSFRPVTATASNTSDLGKDAYRWRSVFGVNGDFSGTVTTDAIDSTGSLIVSNNGTQKLEITSSRIRPSVNFFPLNDNFVVCGQEGSRWKSVASVKGSYSGNLNVEVGGSQRLYNLGTEGDTDTEYLETSFDTNALQMFTKTTGTGIRRNLEFGNADNQVNVKGASDQVVIRTAGVAKLIVNAAVTNSQDFNPTSNKSNKLGSASVKWSQIYAGQGRFESLRTQVDVETAATVTMVRATDHTKLCDCTSNAITVNLDQANAGIQYVIKKIDSSANAVTITANGSETIDGSASITLIAEDEAVTLVSDGSNWHISSEFASPTGGNPFDQSLNTTDSPTFVNGNFSGTIDTNEIEATGALNVRSDDSVRLYAGTNIAALFASSAISFYKDVRPTNSLTSLGNATDRWGLIAGIDGSFSGNLITEVGGSQRVYNLGTEGDADTEYLGMFAGANEFYIRPEQTGSGAYRTLRIQSAAGGVYTSRLRLTQFGGYLESQGGENLYVTNGETQVGQDIFPKITDSVVCGRSANRWSNVASVDGSFSGNLNTEVGGSQRVYNLGTEGDTDTEYLETSWSSNKATISTQATGAGTQQSLVLSGGDVRIAKANGNERYILNDTEVRPVIDDYSSLGLDTRRWANTYSVDGDFSGTVTAASVIGTNNLYLQNSVDSASISLAGSGGVTIKAQNSIYQQFVPTGVSYRQPCHPTFDGSVNLGLETLRWANVYSVDGSFSGNLISEVGGTQRVYGLGTEGDADTEYLETYYDSAATRYYIRPSATGAGVVQKTYLGDDRTFWQTDPATNSLLARCNNSNRLYLTATDARVFTNFTPNVDGVNECGTSVRRWSSVASVDGDFSGDVTVGVGGRVNWGDTTTSMRRSGTSLYWSIGGLTALTAHCGGSSKKLHWNEIENQDIDFKVGYNGGTGIDMDGATGNVTFGADTIINSGGSQRFYNLGSEGDTDTEYGFIKWDSGTFQIGVDATGSGSNSRPVSFYTNSSFGFKAVGGSTRFNITASAVSTYLNFLPNVTGAINVGATTNYFARTFSQAVFTNIQTITAASDSLVTTDTTTLCDCTSNAIAITIPTSSSDYVGNRYEIKKIDASANAVTITPTSRTIDGAASITLTSQYQSLTLVSDGTNWFIV